MSQAGPEILYATSGSNSTKRSLWKRATNDISSLISNSSVRKSVKSDVCISEAEEDLSLSELFEQLELLARLETRPAVQYLRQLLAKLEGCQTIKCTLNKMLLKARVELQADGKHTEHLHFRASNALHLSGSDLQMGTRLAFEVALIDDGIFLTDVKGLSVNVTVMKGTFRCDVHEARIHFNEGQGLLSLQTRNPLIGKATDDLLPVDLQADLNRDDSADHDDEVSRADQLLERQENARKLRQTATGMKAFSLSSLNHAAQSALGLSETAHDGSSHTDCLKMIITIYALSLVLVASYFHLMTKVPHIVPIAMTLSAISFLILWCERDWTSKSILAVLLNVFSMMVVTVCLYKIL